MAGGVADLGSNLQCVATVRPATDGDMDLLGRYGAELMQLHHDWDRSRFISPSPRTPSMYSNYLSSQLGKPDVIVLTAEIGGTAAGYVYAGLEGPDYMALRGPAGVIYDIFVPEAHRRQGVGKALLRAVAEGLRQLGATQLVLSTAYRNKAGQRLFSSTGFLPTMVEMTLQLP